MPKKETDNTESTVQCAESEKSVMNEIANLIDFYEKRGANWLMAVGFLSDRAIKERTGKKYCPFCRQ